MGKKKTSKGKTKTATSPKPTGQGLTRSRATFTASWKTSYNEKTNFRQRLLTTTKMDATGTKWNLSSITSIGKSVTSRVISGTGASNYYPSKNLFLRGVSFDVQGKNKSTSKGSGKKKVTTNYKMSAWAGWNTLYLYAPKVPTLTYERTSTYSTTFAINLPQHINDRNYWGTHVEYRTVLRINQNDGAASDIPESEWSAISRDVIFNDITQQDTTTFTHTINDEEKSAEIQNADDAVRWFAVRAVGPPGVSEWIYAKVAYSEPYPAVIKKATVKPNNRKGVDCIVEWDYKISISFPIDNMKVQYAFASPGGVYTEYSLTSDSALIAGKTYYTLSATKVFDPSSDDIAKYYEKIESEYYLTEDEEADEDKIYYAISQVASPVKADIENYYIENNGVYKKTTDIEIESDKAYYIFTELDVYDDDEISTYFERTNEYFVKTRDNTVLKNKSYYTVVATPVVTPSIDYLYEYYDLIETSFVEPVSPSWQDAEIGGDNTITPTSAPGALETRTAKIGFSIDSEIPSDQLLYVRVITTYNNKSSNSGYYMCTDDNGEVSDKETIITEPSYSGQIEPGSNNFFSIPVSNNSDAYGVHIAVVFIPPNTEDGTEVIGVLTPNQDGSVTGAVEIPPQYMTTGGYGFGIYAFIGQYSLSSRIEGDGGLGYDLYLVNSIIRSKLVTYGGDIPLPPTNVTANHLGDGNVLVTWDWNWKEADRAEIAWSDYNEALNSNSPPSTYEVPNSKSNKLIVRNLELGKTWYFWVRLVKEDNPSVWSNVVFENLSSSPSVPTLSLSKRYINIDEKFTASWSYVSTDGTAQQAAKICECIVDEGKVVSTDKIIAEIPNEETTNKEQQYVIIDPQSDKTNWSEGKDYYLAVQVSSDSGMICEKWSDPVQVTVIKPIDNRLISTSLYPEASEYSETSTYSVGDYVLKRIEDPDESDKERTILYKCNSTISTAEEWNEEHWIIDEEHPYQELRSLPLTVSAEGSDDSVELTAIIERSRDYFIERPDEGTHGGHEGQIVVQLDGEDGQFSMSQEDILGYLDDGAYYYLTIRATDNYGQLHEVRHEFMVNWTHQALMPSASIDLDDDYLVSKITINTPENIPEGDDIEGDYCDIYRRSADGYELLYEHAEFGQTYVDPYPTLGDHGGYRIVYITRNGDYITASKDLAWIDLEDDEYILDSEGHLIDFDGDEVELMYNVDLDNSWRKDFQETHYLGGSIQGDWNAGVSKTTNISVNVLTVDWDVISNMRRLARHEGECHVRTRDGSNFLADVEVSERMPYAVYTTPTGDDTKICEYSLSITKLDPIEPDGMTLAEWEDTLPTEPEEEI